MEPVKLTYDLPVSLDAAFYLFVHDIDVWWPSLLTHDPAHYRGITLEAQLGGRLITRLDDEDVVWGEVIDVEAPHHVVWRQWWRQNPEHPSLVSVRFSDVETGTRLHFEHGGWTRYNAHQRQRFVEWPVILANFVAHTRAHARGLGVVRRSDRGVA